MVCTTCGHSGSTAVVCIVMDKLLCVANVGDSECVLGVHLKGHDYRAAVLTKMHTRDEPEEKRQYPAYFGKLWGVLAVTRSFGDKDFKTKATNYVSCEPHVCVHTLTENDAFLIIACDGLWDKWGYQDAVDFVESSREAGWGPTQIAEILGSGAIVRGSTDNVTVLIVFFDHTTN
eukprot:TRINITY_DN5527_c0_g1_i1.p2 TRINITY_DN5527_c0_g1~~TRINITY_DN5527_c0_g1_i1.p2  ORF type:complete len:184 (+),score=43.57 TRINITY_DN5527_c0_g1_i1:28-552(+)